MCDGDRRSRKRAWAAAEKERERCKGRFGGALTFFYMLKLMERNKRCHHSFSPFSLCLLQTHTQTHTYEWAHTLPVALANVARKCLLFLLYPTLHVMKVKVFVIAESQPPKCSQRCEMWLTVCLLLWLVGGDLRKKQQRIPLYPRQPGESSQHETVQTQLSGKKTTKKQQLLGVMKWSA